MSHYSKKLAKAIRKSRYVSIDRGDLDGGLPTSGYLLWVSRGIWALQVVVDHRVDGYSFFRNRDVECWRREKGRNARKLREFLLEQEHPDGAVTLLPPELEEWNDWSFLRYAHLVSNLVWIEMEKKKPGSGWLGRVVRVDERSVTLRLVDAEGNWESSPETKTFRFKHITHVRLGGHYNNALWRYLNRNGNALETAGGYFTG